MSFVRTVLGDIEPAQLGITDAHDHIIIAGGKPVEMSADFLLIDVDRAVSELSAARELGLRSVIDAMPADCGRDASLLAEVSRRSGINIVAPTGLHDARFYEARHWGGRLGADRIAELFVGDVTDGIDAFDYGGPVVERTEYRAGVIKVGGSGEFPTPRDRIVFEAAAQAQARTGAPILTHCEGGKFGIEQVKLLVEHGADPTHVALSHVDKVIDRGYHRELAASGARVEYDQAFRWGNAPNATLQLIEWMVEDDLSSHVLLGLDAARQDYWSAYGGAPGISYLVDELPRLMASRGISQTVQDEFYVANPAATFSFVHGSVSSTVSDVTEPSPAER